MLAKLLVNLPEALLHQYEYEEGAVRSGQQLLHSPFLQALAALACDLQLDSLAACCTVAGASCDVVTSSVQRWAWFRRYCAAARAATALVRRTPLPESFTADVRRKIVEIDGEAADSSRAHEDQSVFSDQHDHQLLLWMASHPHDWARDSWASVYVSGVAGIAGGITGAGAIYGWGHNHRGQLGGVEGAKVKTPTICDALSTLRPIQLAGGEQTLFAVTTQGHVYATGYGAGGRLGIGGSDSVSVPTLLESLQHVFVKKVAVNSGGKHCLALSADGEVYSWGEGEDGKLGHGNKL